MERSYARPRSTEKSAKKFFTFEEATRAISYISDIVEDLVLVTKEAVALREKIERSPTNENKTLLRELQEDTLRRLFGELSVAGVGFHNYEDGIIHFPAMYKGREIFFCLKYGEKKITNYHEKDDNQDILQPLERLEL